LQLELHEADMVIPAINGLYYYLLALKQQSHLHKHQGNVDLSAGLNSAEDQRLRA
jgi:hypothetical protein